MRADEVDLLLVVHHHLDLNAVAVPEGSGNLVEVVHEQADERVVVHQDDVRLVERDGFEHRFGHPGPHHVADRGGSSQVVEPPPRRGVLGRFLVALADRAIEGVFGVVPKHLQPVRPVPIRDVPEDVIGLAVGLHRHRAVFRARHLAVVDRRHVDSREVRCGATRALLRSFGGELSELGRLAVTEDEEGTDQVHCFSMVLSRHQKPVRFGPGILA